MHLKDYNSRTGALSWEEYEDVIEQLWNMVNVISNKKLFDTNCQYCKEPLVTDFHKDDCPLAAVLGVETKSVVAKRMGWD